MKLLAHTTRSYGLLTLLLFLLASGGLMAGLWGELRHEVDEQLDNRRRALLAWVQRTGQLPNTPFDEQLTVWPRPRRLGLSDTLLLDPVEREQVPHRELTFQLTVGGQPRWVTVRKSLVETEDLLRVLLTVLLVGLGGLLAGSVLVNRWLARRIWTPFEQTLAALRGYQVQHTQALALPATRIDEFTELNRSLTQLTQRVAADYRTLKEFTENAAHETQTPLAILRARLEQLMQLPAATDPATAPLVQDLYAATLRLSRLHQALGLLSRIENRQFADAEPVALGAIAAEKLGQLQDFIEAKQLRVQVNLSGAPTRRLNPALAESLVGNLLHNAVKHNLPGGELWVELNAGQLTVANSGPAVPGGRPEQYFERFRKRQAASDSPGLGLSIVEQICRYYGFGLHYAVEPGEPARHVLRVQFGE